MHAPSGSYVTAVTNVSGGGLLWDPNDPSNLSEPYPK